MYLSKNPYIISDHIQMLRFVAENDKVFRMAADG